MLPTFLWVWTFPKPCFFVYLTQNSKVSKKFDLWAVHIDFANLTYVKYFLTFTWGFIRKNFHPFLRVKSWTTFNFVQMHPYVRKRSVHVRIKLTEATQCERFLRTRLIFLTGVDYYVTEGPIWTAHNVLNLKLQSIILNYQECCTVLKEV